MPVITETELKKQIKARSFLPIYVLCGTEQLYIKHYTKLLTEAVAGKEPSDFNFHTFSGEVDLDTLASAIGVARTGRDGLDRAIRPWQRALPSRALPVCARRRP